MSTRKTTRCGAGPGQRGKPEAEGRNPTRNGPPSRGPGPSEDGPGTVDRRLRPLERVRAEVDAISWSPDTSGKSFPHAEIEDAQIRIERFPQWVRVAIVSLSMQSSTKRRRIVRRPASNSPMPDSWERGRPARIAIWRVFGPPAGGTPAFPGGAVPGFAPAPGFGCAGLGRPLGYTVSALP